MLVLQLGFSWIPGLHLLTKVAWNTGQYQAALLYKSASQPYPGLDYVLIVRGLLSRLLLVSGSRKALWHIVVIDGPCKLAMSCSREDEHEPLLVCSRGTWKLAVSGKVCEALLRAIIAHRPYIKRTDRRRSEGRPVMKRQTGSCGLVCLLEVQIYRWMIPSGVRGWHAIPMDLGSDISSQGCK